MNSFLRPWGGPLLLGLLTASGLITALLSDEAGDVWSWLGLGVPVAVMGWYGLRRPVRLETLPPRRRSAR